MDFRQPAYREPLKEVKSLKELAEKEVIKNLGGLAGGITSRFACGGELASPENVKLAYRANPQGHFQEVVLPGASEVDIQQLLGACSIASFGLDDQQVTDASYRNALKLDPVDFLTSFHVSETSIQLETARTMVPNVHCIRAELYKLNIYSKGSFFKPHVDTPRSDQMFGSLVVCLPTQFSGGALVTRHRGRQVKFDWSSPCERPRKTASWAVLFSDVEHEVLPVTEGHRITLTYNLYSMGLFTACHLPAQDVTINPLYRELHAALRNPTFKREGAVLGFRSHHKYVYDDLNDTANLPALLKGADRLVYLVAKSLGLSVFVKPVIFDEDLFYTESSHLLSKFSRFKPLDSLTCIEMGEHTKNIKLLFGVDAHRTKYITWCQNISAGDGELAAAALHYGNEHSISLFYRTAAILVGIPKWGEYRRRCSSTSGKTGSPEMEQWLSTEEGNVSKKRCLDENDSVAILQELCYHGEDSEDSEDSDDLKPEIFEPPRKRAGHGEARPG